MGWLKTSPAMYRCLQIDSLFTLPTESYLKQLSSGFSLQSGLSQTAIQYLKTRTENLQTQEKAMALIIDEVTLKLLRCVQYLHFKVHM